MKGIQAARFFIENKHDVQKVGLRTIAISTMMDLNFKKGTATNIKDTKVEILIQANKDEKKRIEELQKEIIKRLEIRLKKLKSHRSVGKKNPNCSPIVFEVVQDIPDLMWSSQSLQLDQTGEGVIYLRKLDKLDEIAETLAKILKKK